MKEPAAYKLYIPPSLKIMLSVMVAVFLAVGLIIFVGPVLVPNWNGPPWFMGFLFLGVIGGNALWVLSLPHKIVFHQDGTIDFISVLRCRSFQARDILSIKPEGTSYGFLVARTARSKIRLLAQFDGFHDFLVRLKAFNPVVELRGC